MNVPLSYRALRRLLTGDRKFKKSLSGFLEANSTCNAKSPLVLIWELGGFERILAKNSIISSALNTRGYRTHFVICDGLPEACINRGLEQTEKIGSWRKRCPGCLAEMKMTADKYCVEYSLTSQYVAREKTQKFRQLAEALSVRDIFNYEYQGIKVGELAWSSTNRFMKGYIVDLSALQKEQEIIFRKYFYAALINSHAACTAIQRMRPLSILTSHGVYVDYAPPMALGFKLGINCISWASGFADYKHYFTVPKAADKLELRGMAQSEWEKRSGRHLSEQENSRLDTFIHNRYFNAKARDINIVSRPENIGALKQKLEINDNKPIVALFAHINWDACFDMSSMLFDTANQWVVESIKKMITLPQVNWIIRIHPGEKTDGSLFTTDDVIKKEFQSLPDHIKIIWSGSKVNSFGIYQLIDAGITIFGTVGVELSLMGKPIITAGNAHFAGKGFSIDAKSRENYFALLRQAHAIQPLSQEQIKHARQYAYSYFIQRQIPLDVTNNRQGHWGDIDVMKVDSLLPGRDLVLDLICDGVIKGKDVILTDDALASLPEWKDAPSHAS